MTPRTWASLSWCAVIASALPARADDTADIQSILNEQVITTASTTAERASAAPALSTTITAEDLQLYGIRTLAEAINFLSLGVVTSDPLRTPDIGARGVLFANDDGKHFLLLVNGHAINDALYGAARFDEGMGVPIDLIDHIEVIVGPGSVLYGSNAMMGVINVITKGGSDYRGGHATAEFEPGGSARGSVGTGFTFDLFGAKSELSVAAQYVRRFGPDVHFPYQTFPLAARFGGGTDQFHVTFGPSEPAPNVWGGTVKNANFSEAPSAMIHLRSGDFQVDALATSYRRGIPYATASLPVEFDDGDSYELERSLRLDIKHQATLSALVQLTSRVYGDTYDYQRVVDVPGTLCLRPIRACRYYDAGLARWIGIEERASLNWLHDQSLVTLIGIDARERWASAKEDFSNSDTGQYLGPTAGHIDTNAPIIAPYVQQTYSPTGWLDMNAGARLDDDTRFSPVLSPRAAIALRPWQKTTFKAVYSQAFRAPTWAETVISNYLVAPSDNLQPETVRSLEGSIEQRVGTQRLVYGVFRTWWENLIEPSTLSETERAMLQAQGRIQGIAASLEQFRNLASVDNYGFNAGWDGTLVGGHLRYGTTLTGAYTRLDQGSGPMLLAVAPQFFGNAHLAYAFDGYVPTPAVAASYMGPRPADRTLASGGTLPAAPALADFRLTLTGRVPGVRGLSYHASGDYITAKYGPYTAGPDLTALFGDARMPGFVPIDQFRVFVGLRYDFLTGARSPVQGGEVQ
jgi:outer membrane receptor protein involved in Fe transport